MDYLNEEHVYNHGAYELVNLDDGLYTLSLKYLNTTGAVGLRLNDVTNNKVNSVDLTPTINFTEARLSIQLNNCQKFRITFVGYFTTTLYIDNLTLITQ